MPWPKKVEVTLNADSDMFARAKKMKVDLDEAFEYALRRLGCEEPVITDARAKKWREENREAIEQYNRDIEKHGMWLQGLVRQQKPKRATKKKVRRIDAR